MPRPMLSRPETKVEAESILSATQTQKNKKQNQHINKMEMDRLLRKPRSKEYMEAMQHLDAGGHVHNKKQVDDILDAIRMEFPDIEIEGVLLGYVSMCYLGEPYEVHTLDITGEIIEHFKRGETLMGGLERARSLAMRGGYAFIEVYVDCCRCVSENGTVSVVSC